MSDTITRLNAALEGRYTLEREIGEGGMATVYLADDLRHERKVALKVLKPELAAVVGAERFLTEIKTTANLQHPHILPLFDSGEADTFLFYVMPYVEGETLGDRIDRENQLPVDEALGIATSVAAALQHAHDKGVIHRDIKPGNILLQDGQPVVGDFGIALAVGAAGGARLTETGLSVGTPFYMSPEQATGDQGVGPASDTYALACVLYEMLVGEPPYPGKTAQAVLGKIIQGTPVSATAIRKSIPPNVDAAIRKALERIPADRFTGANDFAKALADPSFRHGDMAGAGVGAAGGLWKTIAGAGWGVALVSVAAVGWSLTRPEPQVAVERFLLDIVPEGMPALTPDGSAMVVNANNAGQQHVLLRRWDNLGASPVSGTEAAGIQQPVVSPSGDEVAYIADGQLKVAPLAGGVVRTLTDSATCCSRWGSDGFIYYSPVGRAINRVPAAGGAVEVVTSHDGEEDPGNHGDFQVLPEADVGVFTVWGGTAGRVDAMRLSTGERTVLTLGVKPYVTTTGHLVFASLDGQILAAPFDAEAMELSGAAVPLVDGVFVTPNSYPVYSVSESGTLVYMTGGGGGGLFEFVWVSRSGQATPVDPSHSFSLSGNYGFRLSPDDTRIAFNSDFEGNTDIRIKHLPNGPEERLSFSEEVDYRPLWAPDGQSVTYFSGPSAEDRNIWSARADGTGQPTLILDDERSVNHGSWSPDGEWLVVRASATAAMGLGLRDILAFRPGMDTALQPLVASEEFAEAAPEISPDGRWLAYSSNETGRDEIFVRPFPDVESTRVRVSTNGGILPLWANSGTEVFFVDSDNAMVAASFDPDTGRVVGQETLFTIPAIYLVNPSQDFYDVSSDDQRFLMARVYVGAEEQGAEPSFVLVQNWLEEVKARVPN